MKACIIQPPYSRDTQYCDEYFQYKLDQLEACDETVDIIVLPEYSDVPCATKGPEDTLYYDEDEEGNQVPYRWVECLAKPEKLPEPLLAGRVKFYRGEVREYMEIGGRFFKKVTVYTPGSKLN